MVEPGTEAMLIQENMKNNENDTDGSEEMYKNNTQPSKQTPTEGITNDNIVDNKNEDLYDNEQETQDALTTNGQTTTTLGDV